MSRRVVERRPSETALFNALRRAIASNESVGQGLGSDDLAVFFLPPHWRFLLRFKRLRANIKERLTVQLPGVQEHVMARTAYFDRVFVDALTRRIPQIVLLGAGYDSRAYRFAQSRGASRVFELDAAPTKNRKARCLGRAGIGIPQHVTLAPIDFDRESLKDVLVQAGFESQKETLFLWEGVSYYLEPASADATLEFVGHQSHQESTIAFDYAISVSQENLGDIFGAQRFFETMREQHGDEGFVFAIDDGGAEPYLEERGLTVVEHLDSHDIERTLLLNEDGSLVGKVTGVFRIVLAAPSTRKR
jgi:methyltransferase (TIGR00027 family)